ncbi:MAG: FHA domain-containing protein [Myxococcaceae bacterium]
MMEQNSARPARKVGIADHIWDVFEEMAEQMGVDRDGLINQAMFMFARLNGFMETSVGRATGPVSSAGPRPGPSRGAPPMLAPVGSSKASHPAQRADERSGAGKLDDDPVRREVAERVLETAAELERLIKGKNDNRDDDEVLGSDSGVDSPAGEESSGEGGHLYLMAEGGELDKIAKDRFVIGRGKHCDFVINSGKVSREHAVIVREGSDYFIEDLGSSNGTWFNKQRIKRRKVEDGDEYFICSERIKLVVR